MPSLPTFAAAAALALLAAASPVGPGHDESSHVAGRAVRAAPAPSPLDALEQARAQLLERGSRAAARTAPTLVPAAPPVAAAAAAPVVARPKARPARAGLAVVRPIAGGYRLTAGFDERGGRWHASRHTGQDFATSRGTPVRTVADGVVRASGYRGSYGLRVEIRHGDGTVTTYSHLSSASVRVGQRVTAGERIGRVGSTGNTTGAHLHLEVLLGGESFTDPLRWLRAHGALG